MAGEYIYYPQMDSSRYTFYPGFEQYQALYRGLERVWLGNGNASSPSNPLFPDFNQEGILYASYVNEDVQILGPVTDYQYALQKGYQGSFSDWVSFMLATADHVINAEKWATGGTGAQYTTGNSAKEQADRAAMWAAGTTQGNGSSTNNSKYWAEQSKNSATAASGSETDAERWATGGTGGTYTTGNSAKEQAERSAMWAAGTTTGNGSPTNNAKYWSEQSSSFAGEAGRQAQSAQQSANTATNQATVATEQANIATQKANSATNSEVNAAQHNREAQQWATGGSEQEYTTGNSAKEQADRAAVWAVGLSDGNGSPTYNSKYFAEKAESAAANFDPITFAEIDALFV